MDKLRAVLRKAHRDCRRLGYVDWAALFKEAEAAPAEPTGAEWVDKNVTGNPSLMQAMRNHAAAAAERGELPSTTVDYPPLPDRLIRFTLRDLKAKREALNGFVAFGNELGRAREYDQWILSLERYIETAQDGGANE